MNEGITNNEHGGVPQKTPKLEKGDEIWKTEGINEEEIQKIKKIIGKDFENLKFKFTKYSSEKSNFDRMVNRQILETEASLATKALMLKKAKEQVEKLKKIIREIDKIDNNIYRLGKDPSNKEKIIELKKEIEERREVLNNLLDEKSIDEKITDNN